LYVGIGGCVVALWWAWPLFFLIVFLLTTVLHFSGDPVDSARWLSRILYGGAIIVLPHVWYADEVLRLFQFLVHREADAAGLLQLSGALRWLAWPWFIALIAYALFELRASIQVAIELIAVAAIALVTPPLIAFAVFFCAMHGARHVLRTLDVVDHEARKALVGSAVLATVVVFIFASAVFFAYPETAIDVRLVQIVFVGLAALTVPHMALVERVRFRGWR
jgi:beta-carotene 15,15'-dioxygenase